MAIDPYVTVDPQDAPRARLPIPPARGWRPARPGDLDPVVGVGCQGILFGTPGPDSGYALTLALRFRDRIKVRGPETVGDAEALAAGLAMRRAALLGRAPIMSDLEVGFTLFGWLGDPPQELVEWRRFAVAGVEHDDARRLALIDSVPDDVLRLGAEEVGGRLAEWRRLVGLPRVDCEQLRLADADFVEVGKEVGRVAVHPHGSCPQELVFAGTTGEQTDPQAPGPHRGQHVPDAVAHDHRVGHIHTEAGGGGDEEVRIGLGVGDLVPGDQHRGVVKTEEFGGRLRRRALP